MEIKGIEERGDVTEITPDEKRKKQNESYEMLTEGIRLKALRTGQRG